MCHMCFAKRFRTAAGCREKDMYRRGLILQTRQTTAARKDCEKLAINCERVNNTHRIDDTEAVSGAHTELAEVF